ncbi:MAG TPA: cupin domain-containing protein [Candidatus Dormibacteraeota bacterium]|jgi:quercetin dioxygenase-like cupin family protein|nr:cupin domain-containing protein [Candidatus Dormibacteraeota bacterium]
MSTAVVRQRGEGEYLAFAGGGTLTIKAGSADTGGSLMVFEDRVVRGKTTPLHLHPNLEEVIYVVEGEILAYVDGQEWPVGAGGILIIPRGVPHALLVTSETGRLLCAVVPGTGEAFFREASDPAASESELRRPDFERLEAVAARSDSIEVLGPPPFAAIRHARPA